MSNGVSGKFLAISLIAITVILIILLSGIMIEKKTNNGKYRDPVVSQEVQNGQIVDRNGKILFVANPDLCFPLDFHAFQLIYEIEQSYESSIVPKPGFNEKITYGLTVHTTLDTDIQFVLDEAFKKQAEKRSERNSCAAIIDADTGEILASSTYPFCNAQNEVNKNLTLLNQFEYRGQTIRPYVISKISDHNGNAVKYSKDIDLSQTKLTVSSYEPKDISMLGSKYILIYWTDALLVPDTSDFVKNVEAGLKAQSKI